MPNHLFFQLKSANIGSILIEFVFCVPVIIILLFFVNDHFRFYELRSKLKTTAYLAASMTQQLGNTRENKQLTRTELKKITFASSFNLFHTSSMYSPYPLGIFPIIRWVYVKRNSYDNYQSQAISCSYQTTYSASSFAMYSGGLYSATGTRAQIENLHPDLVCENDGDERVLICAIYHIEYSDIRRQLGLFVLPLKESTSSVSTAVRMSSTSPFQHKVVFTPKPGLFPVKDE